MYLIRIEVYDISHFNVIENRIHLSDINLNKTKKYYEKKHGVI